MPLDKEAVKKQRYLLMTLLPISLFGGFLYGLRVPIFGLIAALYCLLLDSIFYRMRRMRRQSGDFSAAITGFILSLLMPASVSLPLLLFACTAALGIGKHPFGGYGANAFNPAAVGFSLSLLLWPEQLLVYPEPLSNTNLFGEYPKLVSGVMAYLDDGARPAVDIWDMLLGQFAGPVAQSSLILLTCCLAFLIYTKTVDAHIPVYAIVTYLVFAFVFPQASFSRWLSPIYELSGGFLLFGLIFMATDPVTLPQTDIGRSFYGVALGIAAMVFRRFGQFELGFCFALIFIDALSPLMDKFAAWFTERYGYLFNGTRKRRTHHIPEIAEDEEYDSTKMPKLASVDEIVLQKNTKDEIRSFLDGLNEKEGKR